MKMTRNRVIHYRSMRRKQGKQRYEHFLSSCERQLQAVDEKHIRDLIADAQNKKGTRMLTGVPPISGISQVLDRDLKKRFKRTSQSVYALRKKEVEV